MSNTRFQTDDEPVQDRPAKASRWLTKEEHAAQYGNVKADPDAATTALERAKKRNEEAMRRIFDEASARGDT
jgi:hypothetical protein